MNTLKLHSKILEQAIVSICPIQADSDYRKEYETSTVDAIAEMVETHGFWGWCDVEVEVDFNGVISREFLGGCSYADKQDFKHNSMYYCDMVEKCVEEIANDILTSINFLGLTVC